MTRQELIDNLRTIVNTPANSLTADDRKWLDNVGNSFGLKRTGQKNCKKCLHAFAIEIYERLKSEGEPESEQAPLYVLREGVDVWFGNIRVNRLTMTDELARRIIARGFEKKYFDVCE